MTIRFKKKCMTIRFDLNCRNDFTHMQLVLPIKCLKRLFLPQIIYSIKLTNLHFHAWVLSVTSRGARIACL